MNYSFDFGSIIASKLWLFVTVERIWTWMQRPTTQTILSRDAIGNWAFRLGFSASGRQKKHTEREREREKEYFHLQLLTSSFQVVVIILFWFFLINIHPHTFYVRLLLQKGQNMFLFFDCILYRSRMQTFSDKSALNLPAHKFSNRLYSLRTTHVNMRKNHSTGNCVKYSWLNWIWLNV